MAIGHIASDVGMYSLIFLLSFSVYGFSVISQFKLAMFVKEIRKEPNIFDEHKFLHNIAFGFPDWDAMQNKHYLERVPVTESTTLHGQDFKNKKTPFEFELN